MLDQKPGRIERAFPATIDDGPGGVYREHDVRMLSRFLREPTILLVIWIIRSVYLCSLRVPRRVQFDVGLNDLPVGLLVGSRGDRVLDHFAAGAKHQQSSDEHAD